MPKTKSSTKSKAAKPAAKAEAVKAPSATPTTRVTVTRSSAASSRGYKDILSRPLRGDLTLGALFAELLGTFILVALLLSTNGNAIVAGITVLFCVMAFSRLSGGHVNPAVTIALAATRQISLLRAVGYIIAQLLGAMLALVVISQFVHTSPGIANPYTGEMQAAQVFKIEGLSGDWRPFFAELLGALVLGVGVAAAHFTRRGGIEAGYMIGGALMLGLLLATQGSAAVLNPAAALGLEGYKFDNAWTFAVYAAGPVIGAVAGAWLFRLLQQNETTESKRSEASV
jgi:aquaporin Z